VFGLKFLKFRSSFIFLQTFVLSQAALAGMKFNNRPILISLAGFNTCDGHPNGKKIKVKIEPTLQRFASRLSELGLGETKILRGCFRNSLNSGASYFFEGLNSQYTEVAIGDFWENPEEQKWELLKLTHKLSQMLEKQISDNPGSPIFVSGFSQGGWLASQMISKTAFLGLKVHGLLTLDPISPLECTPRVYLKNFGDVAPGCQHHPSDWDHGFSNDLLWATSHSWIHFYQTDFSLLHSSPVQALIDNRQSFKLSFERSFNIKPEHIRMDDEPRAWNYFADQSVLTIQESR